MPHVSIGKLLALVLVVVVVISNAEVDRPSCEVMVKHCQDAYEGGGITKNQLVCSCLREKCGPTTLPCKTPDDCAIEIFTLLDDCMYITLLIASTTLSEFQSR
uniref:Expressed conserved protein n=1 Tax=Echinococcus granulosus TaxID=6210 RepID=A0A068WNL3_ECHGR|nr:expressed conserved protein [Echinococcus granulosus]